jgi:GTP:adenosylcobinamide-phosphate guanylyltransferase
MDAIIGAGGQIKPNDPLSGLLTVGKPKALLPIAGKPMVQWTLDAVAGSEQIENVIIIGLDEKHSLNCGAKNVHYIQSGDTIFDNARSGCRLVLDLNPKATQALWISADLPLIEPPMLDWFINQVGMSIHDLYYQIIDRNVMESRFPKSRRTYTKLKGKTVCGGDVSAIDPNIAANVHPAFKKISAARKSVMKQASLVGFWPLLLLITQQMTTTTATKIIRNRLGLDGIFVDTPFAEMGMDVDKPEQYEIAEQILEQRSRL